MMADDGGRLRGIQSFGSARADVGGDSARLFMRGFNKLSLDQAAKVRHTVRAGLVDDRAVAP